MQFYTGKPSRDRQGAEAWERYQPRLPFPDGCGPDSSPGRDRPGSPGPFNSREMR
jgi:hypothetical protein